MISSNFSIHDYEENELCTILFVGIIESAVGGILSMRGNKLYNDRKYSIPGKGKKAAYRNTPLYLLVLVAYRTFFWKGILAFTVRHEKLLLKICASCGVTNYAFCGHIFELLVINLCSLNWPMIMKRMRCLY